MNTNVIAETIAPSGAEEKDDLETKPEVPKEEEEDDVDDVVVPALEEEPSEEEVKQASEKKSIPEKQEEVPEEEPKGEPEEIPVPRQPNPVEGETARERGLRIEIQKLREKVRSKEELIKITPPPMDNKEYEALKKIYSDEELQEVEKLFDVIGKKKGYVKADEMYAQSGNEVLES